ncbi:protoporphyrinogen oxidase HemJ [Methylocapsa acidiphila]|uniref:protoporphyrinogen oxidase HemJ n=1 Tax=Methylocapsa acidiphila TaxID=133552 RepID=UPI0003FFFBC4|nr:protoporphyrinogen oxidase HemJ [Methylocapsa acidiphila]
MNDAYHWTKVLHIAAVIAWMAGMFYLPRLFVYHAETTLGSDQDRTFTVMEGRLLRIIMRPAMIVAWLSGLALASQAGFFDARWLQAKLLLVVLMTGLHGYLSRCAKNFAAEENRHDPRFFRILNEIPTILMLGIIILVVVKPF